MISNTITSAMRLRSSKIDETQHLIEKPQKKRKRSALNDLSNKPVPDLLRKASFDASDPVDIKHCNKSVHKGDSHSTSRRSVTIEAHPVRFSSRLRSKLGKHDDQDKKVRDETEHDKVSSVDENISDFRINDFVDVPVKRKGQGDGTNKIYNDYVIHPEFRLQRDSFDGQNHTLGIATHDKRNRNDHLHVVSYVTDIYQHLFFDEGKYHPRTYMHNQTDINSRMRAILIDWLVEVHMKFRLAPETLFLCVNIIDRYCNLVKVKRSQLQLIGVTAMLLACKYEEISPPEVRDCVFITDRAYTRQDVLDMEQDIVHHLKFKLTVPTAYPFLLRFLHLTKASSLVGYAAQYFLERTLQEHDFLQYRPSLVSAASVVLALNNEEIISHEGRSNLNDLPGIPMIVLEFTGFSESEILECAKKISVKVNEETLTASKRLLIAVKRKFRDEKHKSVADVITQLPNTHNIPVSLRSRTSF